MINEHYSILTFRIKSLWSTEGKRKKPENLTIFQTRTSELLWPQSPSGISFSYFWKVRFMQRLSEDGTSMLRHHARHWNCLTIKSTEQALEKHLLVLFLVWIMQNSQLNSLLKQRQLDFNSHWRKINMLSSLQTTHWCYYILLEYL